MRFILYTVAVTVAQGTRLTDDIPTNFNQGNTETVSELESETKLES